MHILVHQVFVPSKVESSIEFLKPYLTFNYFELSKLAFSHVENQLHIFLCT